LKLAAWRAFCFLCMQAKDNYFAGIKVTAGALAFFVSIIFGVSITSAYFDPGETLDPDCGPLDAGCDVLSSFPTASDTENWDYAYDAVHRLSADWQSATENVLNNSGSWDMAHMWGNHAKGGYLQDVFETARATGDFTVDGNALFTTTTLNTLIFADSGDNKWILRNASTSGDSFEIYNLANEQSALKISADGYVGIGATSSLPNYPLDILSVAMMSSTNYGYLSSDGIAASGTDTGNVPVSLHTAGRAFIGGEIDVLSDKRLKNLVDNISPAVALKAVNALSPVHFQWKSEEERGSQVIAGFFAQDVGAIIPEAVTIVPSAILSDQYMLNYNILTTYALAAIKELDAKIQDLNTNSEDAVGETALLAGDTFVVINFDYAYENKPIITVTPQSRMPGSYWVSDVSQNGFTIYTSESSGEDVQFFWHAFGAREACSYFPEE